MITSRTADKHRNHAIEIGVNEYMGKPYQEDQLLALIKRYTAGIRARLSRRPRSAGSRQHRDAQRDAVPARRRGSRGAPRSG